jgi:hypothetical protein
MHQGPQWTALEFGVERTRVIGEAMRREYGPQTKH